MLPLGNATNEPLLRYGLPQIAQIGWLLEIRELSKICFGLGAHLR